MLSSTSSSDAGPRGFLIRLAGFAVLVLAAFIVLNSLMSRWSDQQRIRQYEELFTNPRPGRAIILGDSAAAHGIDPRYLRGADFFNFASDGAGPQFYADWYPLYKRYQGVPSVVLFSVDWFYLNGQLAHRLDQDDESWPMNLWLSSLLQPRGRDIPALMTRFPLIKNRQGLQFWLFHQASWRQTVMSEYDRGFAPWWVKEFGTEKPERYAVSPESVSLLTRLLATMKQDGTRVIIVQPPEYLPIAGVHERENRLIERLARKSGVPVLNYNGARRSPLNENRHDFIDWPHLNAQGSRLFSERLNHDLVPYLQARKTGMGLDGTRRQSPSPQ